MKGDRLGTGSEGMITETNDSQGSVDAETSSPNNGLGNSLYVLLVLAAAVVGIGAAGFVAALERRVAELQACLQGVQEQVDKQRLELQELANRPDNLREAYSKYFEAMKEVQRLQKGQPNGGGSALSDRLSDVENRLQSLDGQAALDAYGRRLFGGQQRGGVVAELEDRVDRIAQSLRRLIQALSE
jgi:uncharacterized protein HemX